MKNYFNGYNAGPMDFGQPEQHKKKMEIHPPPSHCWKKEVFVSVSMNRESIPSRFSLMMKKMK